MRKLNQTKGKEVDNYVYNLIYFIYWNPSYQGGNGKSELQRAVQT